MNCVDGRMEIQNHIQNMQYIRGTTNTAAAIQYARNNMFTSANGDRGNVANVAVVMTDGGSNDKSATFR